MGAALLIAEAAGVTLDGASLLSPTSLQLAEGECVAVLGKNGAGKTTMLRALAGRMRVTSGSVRLRGAPIDERRREVRSEIAALIEPPSLYPDLTLRENLALVEAAWSTRSANKQQRGLIAGLGSDALEHFGIASLATRFAHELSSGQRQLVSLAITFARPANVLLLDEPEQRLDPDRRETVAQAMLAARDRGLAIAFASHDAGLVERVAQRQVTISTPPDETARAAINIALEDRP